MGCAIVHPKQFSAQQPPPAVNISRSVLVSDSAAASQDPAKGRMPYYVRNHCPRYGWDKSGVPEHMDRGERHGHMLLKMVPFTTPSLATDLVRREVRFATSIGRGSGSQAFRCRGGSRAPRGRGCKITKERGASPYRSMSLTGSVN